MSDQTPPSPPSSEIFNKLGGITRQLHTALNELGYTPKLQGAVEELPDARSRLQYIARLTGEAADKVLNHVDAAKTDQETITGQARMLHDTIARVPGLAKAMPELLEGAQAILAASGRNDERLTEIMMAQDFHDLTGQVIARVVGLAATIEEQLLALLLESAPQGKPGQDHVLSLQGPVVAPEGRTDVVTNQAQVDDLLASLGF
ncbi:protein phosphatase CheZ [Hydrogenophaga sp.]|uniref:protein phosphatase CheZ n=1 Tax=Hydrogenophaga sp. TaxID=1904254 RepID=UPI0025C02416|nr:protein phosphatase CheZ [Hydrogenophaga sp.]